MRMPVLFAAIALIPLTACSDYVMQEGAPTPDAGDAVRQNIAAQLVNPNAPTGHGPYSSSGERASRAQERYIKGKVIPPEDVSTKKGGVPGGSSNADDMDEGSSKP